MADVDLLSTMREICHCEVCGSRQLVPVLDLGRHPLCDDLVPVGDPRVCRRYPIEVLFCESCRTAHQRYQVPKQELFPPEYHYRARCTADVLQGMADLVAGCERSLGGLDGRTVLDVGCNDGSLLDFFRSRGASTVGVEPTNAAADALAKGHDIWRDFLTVDVAEAIVAARGKPDLITFTNVFAHIEDLPRLLESLRRLMAPGTAIVIENHYLGSVLDRNQFDTFYHEHPRTYSFASFVRIAQSLGLSVREVAFPSRYGGNIRVLLGHAGASGARLCGLEAVEAREAAFLDDFAALRENLERWRTGKRRLLLELASRHGRLRAKGFPGRAAIAVQLLGLDESLITAVYEKPGSMKIGHFVPGTRIPIVSDEELFRDPASAAPLINFAWHIPQEIRRYLTQHGVTSPVLDILDAQDFRSAVDRLAQGGGEAQAPAAPATTALG